MSRVSRTPSGASARRSADQARAVQVRGGLWRLAWLAATAFAAGGLQVSPSGLTQATALALAAGSAPALFGLFAPRGRVWGALGLVGWVAGGGAACLLTGGISGPLAAWCLAPIAAAAMSHGRCDARRLAMGAALAVTAVAVVAVAQLAGLVAPPPPPTVAPWLALLALTTVAFAVGASLILNGREAGQQAREARIMARVLKAQPLLLIFATPFGAVRETWGAAIEGAPPDLLMEGGLEAIARPEDAAALREAFAAVIRDGAAETAFTPRLAQDRAIAARFRRLGDSQIVIALSDVTADRAHQAELEQGRSDAEDRAAGRSRFLANMSHELRTPLNAIMGFSDIMRARMFGPLPDRYGEYADLIHESGRHLLDLISDLLDMSKIEAERYQLDRELFDAREAVNAALRLMRLQADAAGVALRGVLPAQPIQIDADRRAIKQIVLNLVSNALKFTPKGGAVTVTAQLYDDQFELIVADTGVGISPEDLTRLGRPFEQAGDSERRAMGSGLGLSLVRAFAELHGGEMLLESRLGAGATVTVRLPVAAASSPPAPAYPLAASDNVIPFTPMR
jgi:cell cycle sensor histidine kinase DivJ